MNARVMVVSGGSRGLGFQLVTHFLGLGDIVTTFSRSKTREIEQIESDPRYKEQFRHSILDVADPIAVKGLIDDVFTRFGRIDVLINNAAVVSDPVLATMRDDQIDAMLDVNLKGNILLTRACVRYMLINSSGRILNISSVAGLEGYAGLTVYGATKAAVIGLTRSLAREVGKKGITVNAIASGYIADGMATLLAEEQKDQIVRRTPLGRLGTAGDIVPVAEFLLSEGARFITGQVIVVDGGLTS